MILSRDRLIVDDEIDWAALDRYVAGEGTPEEREIMRRPIQASPVLTAIVVVMRSARRASIETTSDTRDADAAWRILSARWEAAISNASVGDKLC